MRLAFRPLTTSDLTVLAAWLAQPHVARWWRDPHDLPSVVARYEPCLVGTDPTHLAVLVVDGQESGMFQSYRLADELDWSATLSRAGIDPTGAAGIDYLIGIESLVDRGIGTQAIRLFSRKAFDRYDDISRIVVTVSAGNTASRRALEKAGYVEIWSGEFDSADPGDQGPQVAYELTAS